MQLIKKMETELKVIWHKANLSKTEQERSAYLSKYHQLFNQLKKQRIQAGVN